MIVIVLYNNWNLNNSEHWNMTVSVTDSYVVHSYSSDGSTSV